MKAQSRKLSLVPESSFNTTELPATTGTQTATLAHTGTAPMAVDAEAGARAPTMSIRFDADGSSNSSDLDDELFFLMSLDSAPSVDAPVDAPADTSIDTSAETPSDATHGSEAGQHRPRLNWPPLAVSYPVLVVPAERLAVIRSAKDSGLFVPRQQGLSGQGLDVALREHCIAPPMVPALGVIPAPINASPGTVPCHAVLAERMSDDGDVVPAIVEEDSASLSASSDILVQLRTCRSALAASGSCAMQDLIGLLSENGGAKHSRFFGGEAARIDIARELLDLLGDLVAMDGTPQARFDQASLTHFGLSVLQWCGRSSYAFRSLDHVQRYSVGVQDMVDENIINTLVLLAMWRSEKMRDFMLGTFEKIDTELKEHFRISTKFRILRQLAVGDVTLSPAEMMALCTLKLSSNTSSDRLLFRIRKHADQLSQVVMNYGDKQGASAGLMMQ